MELYIIIDKVITTKDAVELALNNEHFSVLVEVLIAYNFEYTTVLSGTDVQGKNGVIHPADQVLLP